MFIPLRPRIKLTRFPWLTLLVTVICIAVFIAQDRNQRKIYLNAKNYCTPGITRAIEDGQKTYIKREATCPYVLSQVYLSGDPGRQLQYKLKTIRTAGGDDQADALEKIYTEYSAQAPRNLTSGLWHPLGSWNPVTMVTSTLAHGSWRHLIGNLFFFVSFSLIVEMVLGMGLYMVVYFALALGVAAVDNLVYPGVVSLPTLGLSGIVMGMMVLAAYFAPRVRINYFYLLVVFPGVLAFPQWMVAGLYVVLNVADIYWGGSSLTNYVAHIAGALVALMIAFTVFRSKRHWADDLLLDERGIKDVDPNWIEKLRQWASIPLVLFLVATAYLWLLRWLIQFMSAYSVQVLIIAPLAILSWHIYKTRQDNKAAERARLNERRERRHLASRHGFGQSAGSYTESNAPGNTAFGTRREMRDRAISGTVDRPAIRYYEDIKSDHDRRWLIRIWRWVIEWVVPPLAAIAFGIAFWVFMQLMSAYSVQVLIITPIAIASWYAYKSRKQGKTTDSARFKKAMDDIANKRFDIGVTTFTKLAEGGYTRAQVELAKLYEHGRGVQKLYSKAGEWYRRAAESGNKEAQYRLGLMMLQGQATYQRKEEPLEWLELSAKRGVPEAAMSLAHHYARGRGHESDVANACTWYHRAGELFLQQRRFEDAEVTIKEIRSLDPAFEQLSELENNLARLTA